MAAKASVPGELDPVDVADPYLHSTGDPHAVWRLHRRIDPVHWSTLKDGRKYWSVTSYAEAVRILRDHKVFSSRYGIRLGGQERAAEAAADRLLIVTDPPRHGQIRRLISGAFTPRTVHRLEKHMRVTVAEMLDTALAGEVCEFTRIAAKLPVSVICDLLGVPREDWDFMLDRTTVAFGSVDDDGTPAVGAVEAHTDILLYYAELVERRRRRPQDDVISALVQGTVDGQPLTDEEIFLNCDGLISGGNETTRHAAVGGAAAFAVDQEQWRLLRSRPELLNTAVDEILRWTSPGTHVLRTAQEEVSLAGKKIAAGEQVVVWLPSANRDSAVFGDGDTFRVDRTPNRHLAFGHGAHFCLGSALAVTELRVLFAALAERVVTIETAGEIRRVHSNHISGFEKAPLRLTPVA